MTDCTLPEERRTNTFDRLMSSTTYAVPSKSQIKNYYMLNFYTKLPYYKEHFNNVTARIISADHTFKVRYYYGQLIDAAEL
jgi:hypothetical protein